MRSHRSVFSLALILLGVTNGFVVQDATSRTCKIGSLKSTATEVDSAVEDLLSFARKVGPVGSLATEEEQTKVVELATKLAEKRGISAPAKASLRGIHDLVYSAAPGGSSGRLFGPVYGKVTQDFLEDDVTFINAVKIGPVEISLQAEKIVKNDTTNIVKFKKSQVKAFGKTVVEKDINGGGVWKYLFMGEVQDADGNKKLLRVMETPSLFVIEQPIP
ncbi:expressed unknown protein [Seminavis robusta]|uniref:Plastid lipid-associated protein/fibrillin conserved domain-containing protein n=1 Tax=Seminavis robusta TaxID=568900 RepID=A0A9N8DBZ9_9STRA|nr:expressed unknown protein [Seminavis robusta]|eukprot:Sro83_g044250.1 n/a (218) ;mRNA; r:30695-31348